MTREVGITVVRGLWGVMDVFQDGDRVRVDGSVGRVLRLMGNDE
jgi:phosphohistidine swiveling domain-containing protein